MPSETPRTEGGTSSQDILPDAGQEADEAEEDNYIEVSPEESVYFYSTFMPPISMHKYGRMCTCEMFLGIVLFLLNIVMQIGLTYVVGSGVVMEGNQWRYSLIRVDHFRTEPDYQSSEPVSFSLLGPGVKKYGSWISTAVGHHLRNPWDPVGHLVSEAEVGIPSSEAASQTFLLQNPQGHSSRHHHKHHEVYKLDVSPPKDELVFHLRKKPMARPQAGKKKGSQDNLASEFSGPLCYASPHQKGNNYTCMPWSAMYVQYWKELDTNSDGIWSYEEARKDEAGLGKPNKTGVKPSVLFATLVDGLRDRKIVDKNLTVPPTMTNFQSIPKAYFDYWVGDAVLCSYSDPQMCSTLVARGFFDAAMNPAHQGNKGVEDLASAMDYCKYMLKEGGGCDQSMPQIYQLYRAKRKEECQDISLWPSGVYANPYDKEESMYTLGVSYGALDGPIKSETTTFIGFLFLVLLLWLLALVAEIREMLKLGEFCIMFPRASKKDGTGVIEEKGDDGETTIQITGITHTHRMIISAVCIFRILVVMYLGTVGCIFLLNDTGYMDLLMNAVALAFILEIDEILFGAVSRGSTLATLEAVQPMKFKSILPQDGCMHWVLQKDFIGLIIMPIISILLIAYHRVYTTQPVISALNCACYQLGPRCIEAQTYNKAWWTQYWSVTLPGAISSMATAATSAVNNTTPAL